MLGSRIFSDVWRMVFKAFGFRQPIKVKHNFVRLEAGDKAGNKVPVLVHYEYHRYFWRATSGNNTKHVITDIVLN